MKKFLLVMIAGMLPLIQAAALEFQLKNGKDMPVYKCGEPAGFTLSVTDEGKPVDTGRYVAEITLDGNKIVEKKELDLAKGNPAKFTGTLKTPGFILVRLRDAENKIVTKAAGKNRRVLVLAGAAFEPEKIRMGYALPEDFMAFWEAGRKAIAEAKKAEEERLAKRRAARKKK